MVEDQEQQSQDLDPIQAMIQQALASSANQPPAQQTQAAVEPTERPTLGERIAGNKPAPIVRSAATPQPTSLSGSDSSAPAPASISPSSSDALAPVIAGATNKSVPPPPAPNWGDLIAKQGEYGKPLDPKTIDPATGKPKYGMGIGQRLLGIAANFGSGVGGRGPVAYTGPGATNRQFDVDEAARQANLGNVNTQIASQKDLAEENRKLYEANTQGQQREAMAQAAESRATTAQQLADIKDIAVQNAAKYNDDKTDAALKKLEEQAKRNDQLFTLGAGNLDAKRQIAELGLQLKQQQMEAVNQQRTVGTDAKSLEAERKQRITSIENDWKQHPYLNKWFGSSKESQIKSVNDEIDGRLNGVGVDTGQAAPAAAGSTAKPAPQTHVFSKSVWAKANPGKDVNAAAAMAKKQNYQVTD